MAEYEFNSEAEQLGAHVIDKHHPRLAKMKVAHLFKVVPVVLGKNGVPKPPKYKLLRAGKKQTWAKASLVSEKYRTLLEADYRFIIEYDRNIWDRLTLDQQEALVDHELCHCGNDADGPYMRHHDLEEFKEIVKRHGFWKQDIKDFAEVTLPLFNEL